MKFSPKRIFFGKSVARKIFFNKDIALFCLIGSLAGGVFALIYDLGIFHKGIFDSATDGYIDPLFLNTFIPDKIFSLLDEQYNPSPFFLGFGFVAFILGFFYSSRVQYLKNIFWNRILLISIFVLCGVSYCFWPHVALVAVNFRIDFIPNVIIAFATGIFVFIFCATFLGMPNHRVTLLRSPFISSFVIVYFFFAPPSMNLSSLITLGLVCCLLVLTIVYITIEYYYEDYFNNIVINVLFLVLVLAGIPLIGFLYLPVIFIYYFIKYLSSPSENTNTKIAKLPKFKKRISITFEWITATLSVIINYTVYGAFLSIFFYFVITEYLRETGQLTSINLKRSYILGTAAFVVYLSFFLYYQFLFPLLFNFDKFYVLIFNVLAWILISFIASYSLGYCLFVLKNEP